MHGDSPRVVLICHESDRLDREGLARWLASTMTLAGLIIIRDSGRARWRAARREIRRVGWLKFLDVVAFRAYARVAFASRDNAWKTVQLERLRERYRADIASLPQIVVATPNSRESREFLERLRPDLMIARCKYILKPEIFEVPRAGTFVLHPGICPEYRNAHGCFWALANRDLGRVGMTLLKVDRGIDTGPIYLQAGCEIDEVHDSHIVIQYRAVLDNLDAIARLLLRICRRESVAPIDTRGRLSAAWGQPRLTNYLRWKSTARKLRRHETRIAAVS